MYEAEGYERLLRRLKKEAKLVDAAKDSL
jgi:hypothetical protein